MVLEISLKSNFEEPTFNLSRMKLLFTVFFAIVLAICVSSEELSPGKLFNTYLFDFVKKKNMNH